MKQPNMLVRFAGTPRTASLLFTCSGLIICAWCMGAVAWWLALMALAVSFRTAKAKSALRRYEAWRAEWDAIGRSDGPAPTPPAQPKRRRWTRSVFAALLLLTIPVVCTAPGVQANVGLLNALRFGWLSLAAYCLFRLLRGIFRRVGKMLGRKQHIEKAREAFIEFAVDRRGACQTRKGAERNLPDYCLRLMERN